MCSCQDCESYFAIVQLQILPGNSIMERTEAVLSMMCHLDTIAAEQPRIDYFRINTLTKSKNNDIVLQVSRTDGRGCRCRKAAGEESPGFAGQDAG